LPSRKGLTVLAVEDKEPEIAEEINNVSQEMVTLNPRSKPNHANYTSVIFQGVPTLQTLLKFSSLLALFFLLRYIFLSITLDPSFLLSDIWVGLYKEIRILVYFSKFGFDHLKFRQLCPHSIQVNFYFGSIAAMINRFFFIVLIQLQQLHYIIWKLGGILAKNWKDEILSSMVDRLFAEIKKIETKLT
jgi:hypothetical protein